MLARLDVNVKMATSAVIGKSLLSSLVLVLFTSIVRGQENDLIILVDGGKIQGATMKTVKGRDIFAFQGIPYARPPIGNLRFKLPEQVEPWNGVKMATEDGSPCPQMDLKNRNVLGNEDCLFLNVYTPHKPSEQSQLPVMVFIHGGGFVTGDGGTTSYSPTKFLDKDVILVTMNYRIGVLGFLSMQDEELPGNYGLFDQTYALHWVQNNIKAFGGDKNRVTIFGQSAGGASVSLHLISSLSNDLYHGVIMQSGTALCDWAIQEDPRKWAKLLSIKLGCTVYSSKDIASCIKTKSVEEIIHAHSHLQMDSVFPFIFTPVVDKIGGFLMETPEYLYTNNQYQRVPIINGITKHEGAIMFSSLSSTFNHSSPNFLDEDFPLILSKISDINKNLDFVIREIKREYLNDVSLSNEDAYRRKLVEIYSSVMNTACSQAVVDYTSLNAPTYTYVFNRRASQSFWDRFGPPESSGLVGHGDDLLYLFGGTENDPLIGEDQIVSDIIINLWTNFASVRNPTPDLGLGFKWYQVDKSNPSYLEIMPQTQMTEGSLSTMKEFWIHTIRNKTSVNQESRKDEL